MGGWKDKDNDICSDYKSCLKGAWRTKGLGHYKKHANNQGMSARDGCCQCGGGKRQVATTQPKPVTSANQATNPGGNNGGTTRRSMFGNAAVAAADDAQTIAIAFGTLSTVCTAMLI